MRRCQYSPYGHACQGFFELLEDWVNVLVGHLVLEGNDFGLSRISRVVRVGLCGGAGRIDLYGRAGRVGLCGKIGMGLWIALRRGCSR